MYRDGVLMQCWIKRLFGPAQQNEPVKIPGQINQILNGLDVSNRFLWNGFISPSQDEPVKKAWLYGGWDNPIPPDKSSSIREQLTHTVLIRNF